MTMLFAHLGLAILWMLLSGQWSAIGLLVGLVLGAIVVSLFPAGRGKLRYGRRLWRIFKLFVVFLREFAISVYRVIRLVLSPRQQFSPGIFTHPVNLKTDFEITLLANLITLTPGTLTVDVADDRKSLLVHAIDCPDPDAARRDISEGFERLIREAFE
jgi:multicomponent Na+:H+ antiporter subunit E